MSHPPANALIVTQRLLVAGRVQGVGYRVHLQRAALAASVSGWVRNRRDGTVEAVVQGAPAAVEQVIAWAQKGPPAGHVTALRVEPAEGARDNEPAQSRFSDFAILPTA
ncbi:MAG: acylphosphatase [Burkholderiales bacterium]